MILDDLGSNAVKVGMLHNTSIIKSVYKILKKYKLKKVVLDPVMIAKGGAKLINNNSKKLTLSIMRNSYTQYSRSKNIDRIFDFQ